MKVFDLQVKKFSSHHIKLGELLVLATQLDEIDLKEAAEKGAVWIQKKSVGKILRIRDVNVIIRPEDKVTLYFDKKILSYPEITHAECLLTTKNYSIWIKEAGVLAQGTQASDHTSILRFIERQKGHEVFLIHRLDRETEGLMIVGHHSQAAGKLSDMFQKNLVKKSYQAIVKGQLNPGSTQVIEKKLDGKSATTEFEVLDSQGDLSLLKVEIKTGRLHQIRRHLDSIGHPVMGDPKYGKGNKNREGLKLLAKSLEFNDPWSESLVSVSHPRSLAL
jgi:tRNA pseudouridine32 synthase / 23S rRNA pseudouridine746 synthase